MHFNTLAQKDLRFITRRQPCFVSKARLNNFKSLKSILPLDFIFWEKIPFLPVNSHIGRISFSPKITSSRHNLINNLLWKKKQLMAQDGIAWTTAFTKISRPASDNCLSFHPRIFFKTIFIIYLIFNIYFYQK